MCGEPPVFADGSHKLWQRVIVQTVIETVLLILSLFTVRDYGYFGMIAAIFCISANVLYFGRGCLAKPGTALRALDFGNAAAIVLSMVQIALTLSLMANVADDDQATGLYILLSILVLIYSFAQFMRCYIIFRIHMLRKTYNGIVPAEAIAQGVPVAVVVMAPGTAPVTAVSAPQA